MSAGADKDLPEAERYLLYIQAGEWEQLRDLIAAYPSDFPLRMYGKITNDLMYAKPLLLATDVLRLADASPVDLDDKQTIQLGRLLSFTIAKTDSRSELMALLRKGTARLGGNDPARRHAAARVLASAEFWNEAKEFGLKESEIPALAAGVQPDAPAQFADLEWEPLVAALRDASRTPEQRDEALSNLHLAMVQSTPETVRSKLGAVLRDKAHPGLVWEVVALIGRKTARGQADFDFGLRRINLELQALTMSLLAAARPLDAPPGPTLRQPLCPQLAGRGAAEPDDHSHLEEGFAGIARKIPARGD